MVTLGWTRGTRGSELKSYFENSIIAVAPILLIIAAGGALGTGSVIFPHVNNAGSWYVKESFGMSLGQMFKSFTVIETAISVVGFGLVATVSLFVS